MLMVTVCNHIDLQQRGEIIRGRFNKINSSKYNNYQRKTCITTVSYEVDTKLIALTQLIGNHYLTASG